jgi:23S rRNA (cytidine1920-2'-O)/16S rRNA (cytidine1409-2'-O)-methyltransferase
MKNPVSRAGEKIEFAFNAFEINPTDFVCTDFGCSTGGFTEALLNLGAKKVYAVDTAYGELAWKLRTDSRVVTLERTNALYVELPEKCDLIVIDTGWTKQSKIIPAAIKNLKPKGTIISLLKPHYEAEKHMLIGGKLKDDFTNEVVVDVINGIRSFLESQNYNFKILGPIESPVLGDKAKNKEYLYGILFG